MSKIYGKICGYRYQKINACENPEIMLHKHQFQTPAARIVRQHGCSIKKEIV